MLQANWNFRSSLLRLSFAVLLAATAAQARWNPTNGPAGKGVHALAIDGNALYVVTNQSVNRSLDKGDTWQDISSGLGGGFRTSMAVRGGVVFIGTTEGIYRRASDGSPWIRVNAGLADTMVQCLAFRGADILAGTGSGAIYHSRDQGDSWMRLNPSMQSGMVFSLAADGANLYAGTSSGFFRSLDDGVTWSRSLPDSKDTLIRKVVFNAAYVFAQTSTGLYRSPDSGAHWTPLDAGATSTPADFRSLDAIGPRLYATNYTDGLFHSENNGDAWSRDSSFFNMANTSTTSEILALGPDLFAGTFHGVFRSSDWGATWSGANTGIGINPVHDMVAFNSGHMLASTNYGIYGTSDYGAHWSLLRSRPGNAANPQSMIVKGGYLFAAVESAGIFRSSDRGSTWENVGLLQSQNSFNDFYIQGPDLYLSTHWGGLLRTTDEGKTWVPQNGLDQASVYSLAACGGILFAGTSSGIFRFDGSRDVWFRVASSLDGKTVTALAGEASSLLAGTYFGGVYRSTDNGATWSNPLDSTAVRNVTSILIQGSDIFVGSDSGAFLSKDHGASWFAVNTGLPDRMKIMSMILHGEYLFVGISGEGIWKRPLQEMGSSAVVDGRHAPKGMILTGRQRTRVGRIGFVRVDGADRDRSTYDAVGRRWSGRLGSPASPWAERPSTPNGEEQKGQ